VARPPLEPDALPVTLHQRLRRKLGALGLALVTVVFPLGGVALLAGGVGERRVGTALAGIAVLAVAGPVWLYWALQLVPGSCRARITTGGFSVRHSFVTREHGWDEVGRFYTRTYANPRITDYVAVAFTGEEGRVLRLGSFLDEVRLRGVADTDILPDTYGYDADELAAFLNACSERYGQRSPDFVPETVPASRGYLVGVSVLLLTGVVGMLAWAAAGAADHDWQTSALALALAAPLAFAVVSGWRRWKRGGLRRGSRFRGPAGWERGPYRRGSGELNRPTDSERGR
jgi:hypothetical protein